MLRMIFRQQLLRISDAVSVQGEFFAVAHDDFAEAQLLHVSAVKDRLDGWSEEGRVILYLREQIDSGGGYFYGAAVLQGDDDIPAFFLRIEDVRFGHIDGILVLTKFDKGNRFRHDLQSMINALGQFRYFDGFVQKDDIVRIGLFPVIDLGTAQHDGCVDPLCSEGIYHVRTGGTFRQTHINIEGIVLHGIGQQ